MNLYSRDSINIDEVTIFNSLENLETLSRLISWDGCTLLK
jgi:hypothetical protein